MSTQAGEQVYISVRAKATPARTKEVVRAHIEEMSKLFYEHGHAANIRIELYDPSLQSAFWKPPNAKVREDLGLHELSDAQLRDLFSQMDTNKDGRIDCNELKNGLTERGLTLPDEIIEEVIAMSSMSESDRDGTIDVHEFIAMSRE
mmetsp:Transcript_32356/g.73119  ORF Transcript_32356/g.73119 Transcript_32356/m.73119 type:complete len:147 (+) Transcript_32356:98-538(+)